MKLLIVTSRFPYPLEKGDKLRIFHQIKGLAKEYDIYLFSLNDSKITVQQLEELKPYCKGIKIHQFGKPIPFLNTLKSFYNGLPFQVNMFINKQSKTDFIDFVEKVQPDHIYCQLARTAEYGRLFPTLNKTLDYMDCFSENMKSRKEKAPLYLKPIFDWESKKLSKYEKLISKYFNSTTIISENDSTKIDVGSSIILNGVDFKHFTPKTTKKDIDILFVGNMNYPPNIDACEYLATKIIPEILKQKPHLKVVFAGSEPSKKVLRLASKNIEITGWVDDMRDYYNKAKIFVAPLFLGTGLQNKILEAMAMQVPVITSSIVNKSIKANATQIIECKVAQSFNVAILRLLNNPTLQEIQGKNAQKFVNQNYNWQPHTNKLSKLFKATPT